jgi:hypothetical protein
MSVESHLSELVRRHQAIEQAIAQEAALPSANDLKVKETAAQRRNRKIEAGRSAPDASLI